MARFQHPPILSEQLINLFLLLADVFIHDKDPPHTVVKDSAHHLPGESSYLQPVYVQNYLLPSAMPEFKEGFLIEFALLNAETRTKLVFVLRALNTPFISMFLTGSPSRIRNMSMSEKEKMVARWRDSPLAIYRHIYRSLILLTVPLFVGLAPEAHNVAIGYPGRDTRQISADASKKEPYEYAFLKKPMASGAELDMSRFDVLVIGSGSGAGVVAHTLAENGFSALVVEKGLYFAPLQYQFNDLEGSRKLYEGNGSIVLLNGDISILAGSTFGGGSTVNWLACLRTPPEVLREWAIEHGVEWTQSAEYIECMDYVWNKMGGSTKNLQHSFLNHVILEGSRKLNYPASEVAQNDGGHASHPCRLCHMGCKYGVKQGSAACWFRSAAERGIEFMERVQVIRILHRKRIAYGVLCQDTTSGVQFTMTGFKKIVVSGGSLNTPIVLQNSGFKNKNIGSNLKLHPVSAIFGDFSESVREPAFEYPILTSVCTKSADLDGKGYGARIETILHSPFFALAFLPWLLSDALRTDLARYRRMSCLLLITRDKSCGTVRGDASAIQKKIVDYVINDFDRNALHEAMLMASDILYIEGARQIIPPQTCMRRFDCQIPKAERKITDTDYVHWRKEMEHIPLESYGSAYGSAHQMSSCRMTGKGPRHGACDSRGRLFECDNIYVADASTLPTASGVNPMITVMAFARKIALGIARDLSPSPNL